jgi:hypothetical protein
MAQQRTLRNQAGAKLYAKRSKTGQFTDIQTYMRAHGGDVKRDAKTESAQRTAKPARARRRVSTKGSD